MMGTDARIIRTQQRNTWVVIRHNLGENYWYWTSAGLHRYYNRFLSD